MLKPILSADWNSGDEIHGPEGMAEISGAKVSQVIRLETLAGELASSRTSSASTFIEDFANLLAKKAPDSIAFKSIVAYRTGLDFDPAKPEPSQVRQAVEFKKPIQFHIGYGDPDLNLHKCDPLFMLELIRSLEALEIPVMLLHTYPYQRNAGYLAQMFRNVYLDVGLAINYAGARSPAIIVESLELAPFSKILFSSDALGLSELTYLGALLFRRGLGELLDSWVARGDWSATDAIGVVDAILRGNAEQIYGLAR